MRFIQAHHPLQVTMGRKAGHSVVGGGRNRLDRFGTATFRKVVLQSDEFTFELVVLGISNLGGDVTVIEFVVPTYVLLEKTDALRRPSRRLRMWRGCRSQRRRKQAEK